MQCPQLSHTVAQIHLYIMMEKYSTSPDDLMMEDRVGFAKVLPFQTLNGGERYRVVSLKHILKIQAQPKSPT